MKKLFTILLMLSLPGAIAFAHDRNMHVNDKVIICSKLTAIQEISRLEVDSYAVRNYSSITVPYIRLALGRVTSLVQDAIGAGAFVSSNLESILDTANFEIQDSYKWSSYRLVTAKNIFSNFEKLSNASLEENDCL